VDDVEVEQQRREPGAADRVARGREAGVEQQDVLDDRAGMPQQERRRRHDGGQQQRAGHADRGGPSQPSLPRAGRQPGQEHQRERREQELGRQRQAEGERAEHRPLPGQRPRQPDQAGEQQDVGLALPEER